jgi:survival-of-motor-neuron-related-splicing factor 30
MSGDNQLEEYETQLAEIEELLLADPTDESLLKLKSDLVELIALTKQESDGDTAHDIPEGAVPSAAVTAAATATNEVEVAAATFAVTATTEEGNEEPAKKKLKKVKEFEVPKHLEILDTDTEKEQNRKKRAIKALKNKHREKQRDYESTKKQQSWQNFAKKTGGKTSIFSTKEGSNAKVGVVSGGSLTEYDQRKRHK